MAECAFGLAEHLGEDLMFEVVVGVGVFDDVDNVLGERVLADYAFDLAFVVVEVLRPGVGGHHFGGVGMEWRIGDLREAKSERGF